MNNKKKSIFFVSIPKSGTDYTWNSLVKVTGMKFPSFMNTKEIKNIQTGYFKLSKYYHSIGDFDTQIMNVKGTKKYINRGYVFGTHMAASYYNIRVLQDAGISSITVLIRNPLDTVISWTYHLKKSGYNIRNYNSLFQFLPADYFDWEHKKQLAFNIRTFLPKAINWIESWLGAFEENYKDINIQLSYYEHLRMDSKDNIESVLDFQGITDYDISLLDDPKSTAHYRKGQSNQWIDEYSDNDKIFVNALIGNRFKIAFENAAKSHRCIKKAQEAENESNFLKASKEYFKVFKQFPINSIYMLLEKAVKKSGNSLQNELDNELKSYFKNNDSYFSYPLFVIKKLDKYIKDLK